MAKRNEVLLMRNDLLGGYVLKVIFFIERTNRYIYLLLREKHEEKTNG